jgi:hypothetical protein
MRGQDDYTTALRMNQSQDMKTNHQEKSNHTQDFSPKVHVLTGMLVSVVSTNTWWFGG